jgi:aspartate carbamoyltransferase catalytic subunit
LILACKTLHESRRIDKRNENNVSAAESFLSPLPVRRMDEIKKSVFQCRFCANAYKETSISRGAVAPKKRGRPKKA